jgi:hypothetical protein
MRRWIDVKPDHIAQLGGKLRVVAELKGPQPVRCQAMGAPDLLHRADRQAHGTGHRSTGPVRGLARGIAKRALDQLRDDLSGDWRLAGFAGLVMQQPVDPTSINPRCQRHTQGLDTPARRITSAVPRPSAVARMIRARQTCFRARLRLQTTASSRSRSPGPSRTSTSFRIAATWHITRIKGILCIVQTTRCF